MVQSQGMKYTMVCFLFVLFFHFGSAQSFVYPVPTPKNGRYDVHGWLILPIDLPTDISNRSHLVFSRPAWFSHHVPEFWTDSPHNFQIIFRGTISPTTAVAPVENIEVLNLPILAQDDLLTYEYSITPPSPFSLNDLLNGDIKALFGVYYNGSFDTPYDRIPESLSAVRIDELTTAFYLDENEKNAYPNLAYLSYPRALPEITGHSSNHLYLAHNIHAQPDFDHIVHGVMKDCQDNSNNNNFSDIQSVLDTPGISWEFPNVSNVLENKLTAGQELPVRYMNSYNKVQKNISCRFVVLESLHCMIGPGFMDNC